MCELCTRVALANGDTLGPNWQFILTDLKGKLHERVRTQSTALDEAGAIAMVLGGTS